MNHLVRTLSVVSQSVALWSDEITYVTDFVVYLQSVAHSHPLQFASVPMSSSFSVT